MCHIDTLKYMDLRLYKAACKGDVKALQELLEGDPLILSKASLSNASDSPLHIAASLGHVEFAKLSMSRSLEPSGEFNPEGYSPIHLASSKGYLQKLKDLSNIDKGLCFLKDRDGRTPLHCAAIKGNLEVVRELILCCPESAKETTFKRETVLHLVVKNNLHCEAVKSLLSLLDEMDLTDEIINCVDVDGDTILHHAATKKQHQVIEILLRDTKVNADAVNASGQTASDIYTSIISSECDNNINGHDHHQRTISPRNEEQVVVNIDHSLDSIKMIDSYKRDSVLLASVKNGTIVLCSLFAIFCLDAILNPPENVVYDHYCFNIFICADVVCFLASLVTIPLAMLTTSFDSFYWRVANVTAGMMIGSVMLLYASVFGLITNTKHAATWMAEIGGLIIIIVMLMVLIFSVKPIIKPKRTSKMLC